MPDFSHPKDKLLSKITARPDLVKVLISYNPEEIDKLNWNADEKAVFAAATISERLDDKLFAIFLIARRFCGKEEFEIPKIILPGVKL